jgi:hypothetical protein
VQAARTAEMARQEKRAFLMFNIVDFFSVRMMVGFETVSRGLWLPVSELKCMKIKAHF